MTSKEDVPPDPEQKLISMDRIKTICVLPAADSNIPHHNIKEELENFARFIENKVNEYEKAISETSAIVFTANVLQNRVASWEFAIQLTKLYEAFGVHRSDEFIEKLDHLNDSDETNDEIKSLIAKVSNLFEEWDLFLKKIDGELEKTVGPQSLHDLTKHDALHLSRRRSSITHNTLQSFIKESAYDMTLISVIVSFSAPESADHTVHMYENLAEFQKYGCDVLMLLREDVGSGGGFLKIVGVPFRQLMGEEEALNRLLQHRQSALTLAGSKAMHMFTEIICNDQTLAMPEGADVLQNTIPVNQITSGGSTILVDKMGHVLYSYTGRDNADWPDVAVLLENVRNYSCAEKNDTKNSPTSQCENSKKNESERNETEIIEISKNKCCIIL